jgi:hypothetical protein
MNKKAKEESIQEECDKTSTDVLHVVTKYKTLSL